MQKPIILIVEDEFITSFEIKDKLELLGYSVADIVVSGEEAIEKFEECQPNLILMDIKLQGEMDGIETAKRILEKNDVPIIYLTAFSDERTISRARFKEPFHYLIKPLNDKELQATIEVALYLNGVEKRLRTCEKYLNVMLQYVEKCVFITDALGMITAMNDAAKARTDWSGDDAMGRDLVDLVNYSDKKKPKTVINPARWAMESGAIFTPSDGLTILRKGGDKIKVSGSATPVYDDRGCPIGAVVIIH